jgi:hypothetical protein
VKSGFGNAVRELSLTNAVAIQTQPKPPEETPAAQNAQGTLSPQTPQASNQQAGIVPGTTYTLSQLCIINIDYIFDGMKLKCEVYIDGTDVYNKIEISYESQRLYISFGRIRREDWGVSETNSLHMYKPASDSVLTSYSSGINDIIFDEYRKDNIELRNARNIAKLIIMLYEETICKI